MTSTSYSKRAERYFVIQNRQETIKIINYLYDMGYRWIARDDEETLSLFNLKPKKYREPQFWGYPDVEDSSCLMAEHIKNTDITELRLKSRQPTEIETFIKENEVK